MEEISEFELSALKEDHCNLYSNDQAPTYSFSKKTKMKSKFTELFRTILHFFIPECIDSCADGKPPKVTKAKTSCRLIHPSVSNSLRPNKWNETSCKETQTDTSYFSSNRLPVNPFSLINSDGQKEKYIEERFQCCSASISYLDLDQNNNHVTIKEMKSGHHPVDSFSFDERSVQSTNEGTDCVWEVKTESGTTEEVQVLKVNLIPFVYDLYKLPVLFKDFDINIESLILIAMKSTDSTVQDRIVWTTWSYPLIHWSNPPHLSDESLADRNDYNYQQDSGDSRLVHWPHFILDGEVKVLNIPQYSSLRDNVPEEDFAENDIYLEDDYLQDYTPSESKTVNELIEDFEFESFFRMSENTEELINSSVKELAGNVCSLRKSCRQKHYSTSDVPYHKTVTCCKETQTEESCFDTYCVQSRSSDPLLGLQIAFECSTMDTNCIEDSTRNII